MEKDFTLEAYNYHLPQENIAQHPAKNRDESRLLVLDNVAKSLCHRRFSDITELISDGDMLVVNDTRVFPARLYGRKSTGGKVEVFLLAFPALLGDQPGQAEVVALVRSSKRPALHSEISIGESLKLTVLELLPAGKIRFKLHFDPQLDLAEILSTSGQVPLPPYISRQQGTTAEDVLRYQTVYADRPGAVAAPTAGLHFTPELLERLQRRGVQVGNITLHVGYGTFAPVREDDILKHTIHEEYVEVPEQTVHMIEKTKMSGGRIWAVGTTTVRALEFAARSGTLQETRDWCDLYIYPGYTFKVIDNLITNFHLPGSSLMFLVSALCGRETLLHCYHEAIREGYQFYSYGDAMAIMGSATMTDEK